LDRIVGSDPRAASLVERLLRNCWLVDSLEIAAALRQRACAVARFVTPAGELLHTDGTLVVGTRSSAAPLVSRKSEQRNLAGRLTDLDREIEARQQTMATTAAEVDSRRKLVSQLTEELETAARAWADFRVQSQAGADRLEQLAAQFAALEQELAAGELQDQTVREELRSSQIDLADAKSAMLSLKSRLQEVDQRIEQLDLQRSVAAEEITAAKVELAKSEQLMMTLREQIAQFQADQLERDRAVDEVRRQLQDCRSRQQKGQLEILRATATLADLYLRRESLSREVRCRLAARSELTTRKSQLQKELHEVRRAAHQYDVEQHRCELAANQLRHEREALAQRLRDDYGIEIAELTPPGAHEPTQDESVTEEIAELRKRLNSIGPVNLDALHELESLDVRFASLSGQFEDLVEAKKALERIIVKINADSRRVFQETLDAIRTNFQTLYRRAFGGGRADLALEEGVDVLEAGIDIIATPPGKPSFSNSLLSGGEKALTAVALLLAIFQYRPSPFCVLDEVDAPFDEANIGRFIDVLKEFLGWTKFVIVTHSKKTMTAATTLYGVTMQESGVSKRVSVRFEDVSEDGHISRDAIERANTSGEGDERGAA
jgi:chromosome segregation protein